MRFLAPCIFGLIFGLAIGTVAAAGAGLDPRICNF
jgi:hypothetical protein